MEVSTLVRVTVLSRLLAEALEDTDLASAQLEQALIALRERAERELGADLGR